MQSYITSLFLVLAWIAIYSGHAFTTQGVLTYNRQTSSALFGKRARAMKKVKSIFKGGEKTDEVEQIQSNFPVDGQKVKLSDGRANELAKKYKSIEDLEERTFQILVDLKMVERS